MMAECYGSRLIWEAVAAAIEQYEYWLGRNTHFRKITKEAEATSYPNSKHSICPCSLGGLFLVLLLMAKDVRVPCPVGRRSYRYM